MDVERVDAQSVGLGVGSVNAIQGAHDFQVHNSSISVIGGDNHTHIHYHAEVKGKLKAILDAISNFRKIQQDTLARATPGTVVWLLECDEFRLFIDVDGVLKILWGSGMPGAGKTILASIVISRLEALASASNGNICVGYVYIRYSDQGQVTIRGILGVLVKQTVERHPDCMPLCEEAYSRHIREGTQPTEEELISLLRLFNQRFKAAFYVLDALDEAPVRMRLKIIQKLASLGARLFITSRPLPALEAKFPTAYAFSVRAQDRDLDLHIAEKISDSEDLQDLLEKNDPAFKERLIAIVKEKCGGMFLHASLQLDALQDCFTAHDAIRTLEAFPRKIEDVYLQTWSRIIRSESPHHMLLAKTAFVWVLNAKQSMTFDLLRHALATCPETYHYDSARLMPEATILAACRGLITADKESKLARLVHYTAKEPLERLLSDSFPHPHSLLTAVCVARLSDCGFQNTRTQSFDKLDRAFRADSLLHYAYETWAFHAQKSTHIDPTASTVSSFVSGCSRFPVQQHTFNTPFNLLTHLHMVAFYNLPVACAGPRATKNPNIPTRREGWTPLHLACMQGHQAPVQSFLCLPGVLVNARDLGGDTPPILACEGGYEGIVTLILTCPDLEINAGDGKGWTALMHASFSGHASIVRLLLTHPGINANLASRWHRSTALLLASNHGHTSVVKLLLAVPSIDVNVVDGGGSTAIKLAAGFGHEDIVRLLLDVPGVGVSVAHRGNGHNALSAAVVHGHNGIARLLQDFEARKASTCSMARIIPSRAHSVEGWEGKGKEEGGFGLGRWETVDR